MAGKNTGKRRMIISDFQEKMRLIQEITGINWKLWTSEKFSSSTNDEKINYRTIESWIDGKVIPHKRKLMIFCEKLGIDYSIIEGEVYELKDYLLKIYKKKIDDEFKFPILKNIINSSLSNINNDKDLLKHLSGYWVCFHYWEKFYHNKESILKMEKKETSHASKIDSDKYIFRHLFFFDDKIEESFGAIALKFASARQWNDKKWNYKGHVFISQHKMYFLLDANEGTGAEVILIIANKPEINSDYISGIILASTPYDHKSRNMPTPASSRILIKKIKENDIKEDKFYFDNYIGIYKDNAFGDNLIKFLKNSNDSNVEILLPCYDNNLWNNLESEDMKNFLLSKNELQ